MTKDTSHMLPILNVQNISKQFLVNGSPLEVLENINFSAQKGELICITGKSGCGKSTLLDILAGFTLPDSGQIILENKPISTPGPDRCVVFQEDALFPWLTVRENIAFGFNTVFHKTRKQTEKETDRFLSMVGLEAFQNYLPKEISGGMKQRVALARVLILRPKVLLMDEPFAALDALTREKMQALLLQLWQELKHTIIFVTHDVAEAVALSDRILVMSRHPGCIRDIIQVKLERPRNRLNPDFMQIEKTLYHAL